ncbi:MAG: hypothetical protein ACI4TU_10480 [Candidatus Cryptobacteroides sp.]
MKTEFENMIASMEGKLTDEADFMASLERNLDFIEQAKQRNDRMAEKSRTLLLKVVICGILVSASIITLSLLYDSSSIYTGLYALAAACLSSILMIASINLQFHHSVHRQI